MDEEIKKLIDALNEKREGLLRNYLEKLNQYAKTEPGPQPQGLEAITWSGLVNDIDKHITNLYLELKRKKSMKKSGIPMEVFRD